MTQFIKNGIDQYTERDARVRIFMGTKILVVDDELDLELLIVQRFRKKVASKEYEFIFAHTGVEALETLKEQNDIEIILTDINMPEMDGLTLLTLLPEIGRPYKAIVVSAYEDMSNIRSAMNKGAVDFITKPIDFQDLEVTLDKTIMQCRAMKEGLAAKDRLLDIEKELDIARKIQQAMIPQNFQIKESKGSFELLGIVLPAKQIGGDFFDFFALDENRIALIIADVSGKSISASLFMAMTKTLFRSIATMCSTTDEALTKVNHFLSNDNPSCMFVTAFYAILDTKSGKLSYSNAGHTPPYLLSQSDPIKQIGAEEHCLPLGVDRSISKSQAPAYTQRTINLQNGDCLFLYTDGVTEATNHLQEFYKEERLARCLSEYGSKPIKELIESVITELRLFSAETQQSDDIAVLCLRYYAKGT